MEITRRIATPAPTVKIRAFGCIILDTWFASTVRSGSATVMSMPIAKHTPRRRARLFSLVRP